MRYFFSILIIHLVCCFAYGQCFLSCEKIELDQMDLSARTKQILAKTGKACALLKVSAPFKELKFQGEIYGDITYDNVEYSIFIAPDAHQLIINNLEGDQLTIRFSDYGILPLLEKTVYHVYIQSGVSVDERVRTFLQRQLTDDENNDCNIKYNKAINFCKDENYQQAYNLLNELIHHTYLPAFYNMGILCLGDYKLKEAPYKNYLNVDEGEYYLRVAADYNNSKDAAFRLGKLYYDERKYEKAFEYMFLAYSKGHETATEILATMYENGIGCEKDKEEAIKIWRELYWSSPIQRLNNSNSLTGLAHLESSPYTLLDFTKPEVNDVAEKILNKNMFVIANNVDCIDDVIDQCLSDIKWDYSGTKMEHPLRFSILTKAVINYNSLKYCFEMVKLLTSKTDASNSHESFSEEMMYPRPLPNENDIKHKAIELIQRKANENDVQSLCFLAEMYQSGMHFKRDWNKALEYYLQASNLGDGFASFEAGNIKQLQLGYNKTSLELFLLADQQGYQSVKLYKDLAWYYSESKLNKQSATTALMWLDKALKLNLSNYDRRQIKENIDKIKIKFNL